MARRFASIDLLLWQCAILLMMNLGGLCFCRAAMAADDPLRLIGVKEEKAVYLQPLDAPGNPWAGQYTDFDRWVYEHQLQPGQLEQQQAQLAVLGAEAVAATQPEGWGMDYGYADAQGFMLPCAEAWRLRLSVWEHDRETPRKWIQPLDMSGANSPPNPLADYISFGAAGQLTAELKEEQSRLFYYTEAADYPPIPAWLGENPPFGTIFIPNGEILCRGKLGLHFDSAKPVQIWEPLGLLWYRYSADGHLLGVYDFGVDSFGSDWMLLYWPQRETDLADMAQTSYRNTSNGTLTLVERPARDKSMTVMAETKLLACYDYDGTPLDPDQPLSKARSKQGQMVDQQRIENIYKIQLERGLTSAASSSPYAGTAEGPQVADSAPQPVPLIASTQGRPPQSIEECVVTDGRPRSFVVVGALDDPANPWRGKYSPWDIWLREQQGQDNPAREAAWLQKDKERSELQQKLKDEKREATKEEQQVLDYSLIIPYDPNDPWQDYQVQVDPQGWQIPLLELERQSSELRAQVDLRKPWRERITVPATMQFSAGGVMPAEMALKLQSERAALRGGPPSVPAWLLEGGGVEAACFAPDGTIVTYAARGTYQQPDYTPGQTVKLQYERAYFHYSADGELLGKIAFDQGGLSALFSPQMLLRWQEAKALGYDWTEEDGVVLIRQPSTDELLEAYLWDGTPLDIHQPIHPQQPWFHFYWQQELNAMAGEQR